MPRWYFVEWLFKQFNIPTILVHVRCIWKDVTKENHYHMCGSKRRFYWLNDNILWHANMTNSLYFANIYCQLIINIWLFAHVRFAETLRLGFSKWSCFGKEYENLQNQNEKWRRHLNINSKIERLINFRMDLLKFWVAN